MNTPFFPAFRSRLAALGHQTAPTLRRASLTQLQEHLRDILPPPLLSSEEEGPNSRDRCFSLRLTFKCFVWQMLQPRTSCREVVRQVQALLRLAGRRPLDESDSAYAVELDRVSFKGTVDALRQYSAAIGQARNRKIRKQLWQDLLLNLARDLIPKRPGRQEPRAVKRRPKPYPLLTSPRRRFVEISHRNRYWKGRPRNYRRLNY